MLVLSRRTDESIVVDGNVTITILRIKGNKVQVGVKAPDDVRILRAELQESPSESRLQDDHEPSRQLVSHAR